MPLQGNLSIERMSELTRVSRARFYRSLHQQEPVEEELEVRSRFSRSRSNTADAMGIAAFVPSYEGEACV
jgi:hypothetical protein